MGAFADQAEPTAAEVSAAAEEQSVQDTVIITGVRGAPRSVIDSPTPIDVFTSEDIEQGSPTGIYESIRYLVPSFNLPSRGGGGTATIIATGGLRGLNPDHTLVLVNGKRRHKTALINSVSSLYNGAAGVDLNMIPSSAIAQIEVLRDGAAAQYGSDAIAGVINIILKDGTDGGEASVSYGQNFDRNDGAFLTGSVNQGYALGESGSLNLSYSFMDRDESNRAVEISEDINLYPLLGDGSRDPREESIDRMVTQNYGAFPQTSHIFGGNFTYETSGVELYAFGTYGARESVLNWSFRAPTRDVALPEVYPNGFRPRLTIKEDDYEIAGGMRGETANGWAWDVSSNYGTDITDWENTNGLNASLGPASPTFFEVGRLISSEWVNSLDMTKLYELETAGTLQVSFGLQHRLEKFEVEEGEEASWIGGDYVRPAGQPFAGQLLAPGSQATPGFRPDDAGELERTNLSVYGELGWSPTEKLFLDAALRYEDFDDAAGDELIYKVNGRYELADWVAVRASYNTGFRAPTLAQQGYSSTTSQFRDLDGDGESELLLLKNLPVNSAAAQALGSKPLTPETSKNASVGFTLTPLPNLSVTVDAYQIDVDDRIVVTSTFSPLDTRLSADGVTTVGEQIQAILVANGLSSEISGQYYTNAIDTETKGIDVVATYRLATDYGDFNISGGFNKNETDIRGIVENPAELDALGDVELFDRSKQGALTDSIPDSKITLGVSWDIGRFSTNVRGTRFGGYTVRNATNPNADYDVDPEWIADLEVGYAVSEAFTIYAGANNVFNTYPEEINPPGATNGSNMYNTFAPFGFTGGSWFLRGAYNW
ncbi:TonB-dependent receptor [uncultured Hyphomonas sp.]|uniref:TonB-dependent receptor plug domain-containing protein n=1 Tax=uncultured Hyphomonas sp. TaxID=225298 RepID=UPI002AABE326|nr:TonB-dependent receptor [uncultured Hyphomonas sp.]